MQILKNHLLWFGLKMNKQAEFWIKNISKMNVSLSDLQLIVPAGRNWNLLDSKHFKYTLEQLEKSAEDGSIFKKSDKIKIRNVAPIEIVKPGVYVATDPLEMQRNTKFRSLIKIEEKRYEELEMDPDPRVAEEKYAAEFAAIEESTFKK